MIICIDGNDGTGKSTLIAKLKQLYTITFQDRGLPSALTIEKLAPEADFYIILSCSVETSLNRLKEAGRDMEEYWHLPDTLKYFHEKFLQISQENNWPIVDSDCSELDLLNKVILIIENYCMIY